jgi:putative transposase
MKLTAKVKLLTSKEQAQSLIETLRAANEACNYISNYAWEHKTFGKYSLQKVIYYDVRESFSLSAQVTIRCIGKVADAYKLDKNTKRTFKPLSAIAYDDRILKWKVDKKEVSIWSVDGRLSIPFAAGDRQLELLQSRQGESDLVYHRGKLYLFATCNVDDPDPIDIDAVLGVDLGIVNIATDSDGQFHSGSHIKSVRYRYKRLRTKLQKRGTKSAKRRLKNLSGKESRFANDVNHVISKQLVNKAQRTQRAIALEDLTGIRDRVRARRSQRYQLHSWSFHDLRQKIEYKAQLAGVPVIFVDPRNTSRTCPACGCVDKRNRKSQDSFLCIECGCVGHADYFASVEISRRADVNLPNVGA